MKLNKLTYAITLMAAASAMTGCDSEREMVIIEGNLPIKTSTLYMVGDATPCGWNIDAPEALTPTAEDPLVFTWEGELLQGEVKFCLTPGSWDAPFIRPVANGQILGADPVTDEAFQMHAGDPDEKWRIGVAGTYSLTLNLRQWTISSTLVKAADAPVIEPIKTEHLYIVGEATPNGWNIDQPTALTRKSEYIFEYEGELKAGEFKACASAGSWDVPFVRPTFNGCKITKDGAESAEFVYIANPDNKWVVADAGKYRLTFDLEHYTLQATMLEAAVIDKTPLDTETLYLIGDATPGGWSMDDLTPMTQSATDSHVFTWEGELVEGSMKMCVAPDGSFACPFVRPTADNCEISAQGVAMPDIVYTTAPDYKWLITKAGRYLITVDLKNWTITVENK